MSDAGGRRDIELRIRAVDSSKPGFDSVVKSINDVTAALTKELEAAAAGKRSNDELRGSVKQLEDANNRLANIGALVDQFNNLTRQIDGTKAALDKATTAYTAHQATLANVETLNRTQESSLKKLNDQRERAARDLANYERSLETVSGDLRQAGIDTGNLATETLRIVTASEQAKAALGPFSEALANNNRVLRERREETARLAAEEKKRADQLKQQVQIEREAADATLGRQKAAESEFNRLREKAAADAQNQTKIEAAAQRETIARQKAAEDELTRLRAKAVADRLNQGKIEAAASLETLKRERAAEVEFQKLRTAAVAKEAAALAEMQRQNQVRIYGSARTPVAAAPGAAAGARPRPGAAAAGGETLLFGLRPYELQNLSYQINDVITQLASGAHLTQVMAQQGGQIFQLWGRNIFSLVQYLPQLVAGIAAVTITLKIFEDTTRRMAAERQFTALLGTMADGAKFAGKELANLQIEIAKIGIAWADAGQIIRAGLRGGVTQEGLLPLATIARDIAVPRGEDVTKVFSQLVEGLQKGGQGIAEFDRQFGILNATELQSIRDTERLQGLQAAQRLTIDLLSAKTKDAADNAGLFTKALKELNAAWIELLHTLEQRGVVSFFVEEIKRTIKDVKDFVESVDDLIKSLKALRDNPASILPSGTTGATSGPGGTSSIETGIRFFMGKGLPYEQAVGITAAMANESGKGVALDPNAVNPTSGAYGIAQALGTRQPAYKRAEGLMGQLEVAWQEFMGKEANALARIKDTTDAGAAAIATSRYFERPSRYPGDPQAAALEQRSAATARGFAEQYRGIVTPGGPLSTSTRSDTAAEERRTRPEREAALRATQATIAESARQLQLDNERYDIEHDLNAERAKAAVYARAQREESEKGLRDDDLRVAVNRRVAEFEVQRAETQRKFDADKEAQRVTDGKNSAAIDAAGLAARQKAIDLAKGTISLEQANTAEMQGREEARKLYTNAEAAKQAERRLNDQINALARGAELKDVTSLEGRLEAVRTKYQQIREEIKKQREDAAGKGITLNVNEERLNRAERADTANETAKFYLDRVNTLVQTRQETIAAVNASVEAGGMSRSEGEAATKRAFEATTPAINDATKALQEFVSTSKDLDPTKIDLYTAKVKQFNAEAQYVDPLWKTIKTTFEQSFSGGLTTAIDTVAQSIGGLIAKTQTWGDVLRSLRNATANFFAQLLRDIAMAVLKYEALKLLGIGGGGGGGILSFLGIGAAAAGGAAGAGSLAGATLGTYSSAAPVAVSTLNPQVAALFHRGGIVGRGGTARLAPAWSFANAPRYHNGAMLGLAPDEQAAILQRGEEVLSRNNPRNIMNGGGGTGEIAIRNVLVDDPRRIPEAMSGAHGEKVIVQTLVRNAATIRELVKG